eukprot:CAMPEP_0202865960 /NCGR_PEP_ID=MMETSP1391-20130828/6787_1 /ASSEMBLY_ACC=CAM_ASM_000867 /TAXON_ID=1034604 /ORGANISM="Chlamydomonas leiostraca, Strain SAG 11-49" /LENGTH=248 /DNA_ID=CAMNT_0049545851 /DNA_START=24 /DNA_END=770 /DNA_ORIENTATION=-
MQLARQITSSRQGLNLAPARSARVGSRVVLARSDEQGVVSTMSITGTLFSGTSFEKVATELAAVDRTDMTKTSFARVGYHPECEAAVNEQINIEYNVSYIYHAMYAYFDRDNVGLTGLAKYFKAASDEEREHAELLMAYQNKRGGRVKLKTIVMPDVDFHHADKGDALYAMEMALALEKLNFQKLRELHEVADKHGDASMADFVEGELLGEQVEAVKKVAEYVSQLRRVGKGLGVYQFDKDIANAPPA